MQKKIIALAVAGLASTAAFAQTNVVVYGVADGTFDYVWTSGRNNESVTGFSQQEIVGGNETYRYGSLNATRQKQEYDGNTRVSANSSYLGFKGSEDLGNGLKALFQYELGVDFTSGTSALSATRDSFVGLSHDKAGTILLGNLTGPTRALGAALDVNPGATGIGANSAVIGKIAGGTLRSGVSAFQSSGVYNPLTPNPTAWTYSEAAYTTGCAKDTTCTSIFDTRWANSIAYLSPNWGGFSFAAAYVANENKTPDYGTNYSSTVATEVINQGVPTTVAVSLATPYNKFNQQPLDTTGYDLGVKWEGMGFMVGLTYNWAQFGDVLDQEVDNLRLGAMYTAPNWSVRGMWEQTEQKVNNFFFGDTKQQKYGLGGTFSFGKTTLLAQWYGANDADNTTDTGVNFYEIGALYNLSKRTMLKATWAYVDNDSNAVFDFGINSAGGLSRTASGYRYTESAANAAYTESQTRVSSTGSGAGVQGVQIGIRHSF